MSASERKKRSIISTLQALFSMSQNKKLKPLHVFLILFGSSATVFSIAFLALSHYQMNEKKRFERPEYQIKTLTQKGPVKEALKSIYLQEMLGLSEDEPQNLYQFDLQRAEQALLDSGVIQSAKLRKNPPANLEIDYELRYPMAYLADYSNTLVDKEGVIFPQDPYFTPKLLPSLYLGIEISPFKYGKVEHEKMKCALDVCHFISQTPLGNGMNLDRIDVSRVNAKSLGQREIILTLHESLGNEVFIRYIRLSPTNYKQELMHFLDLSAKQMTQNVVVDLRMFPSAYLTPLEWR